MQQFYSSAHGTPPHTATSPMHQLNQNAAPPPTDRTTPRVRDPSLYGLAVCQEKPPPQILCGNSAPPAPMACTI